MGRSLENNSIFMFYFNFTVSLCLLVWVKVVRIREPGFVIFLRILLFAAQIGPSLLLLVHRQPGPCIIAPSLL